MKFSIVLALATSAFAAAVSPQVAREAVPEAQDARVKRQYCQCVTNYLCDNGLAVSRAPLDRTRKEGESCKTD